MLRIIKVNGTCASRMVHQINEDGTPRGTEPKEAIETIETIKMGESFVSIVSIVSIVSEVWGGPGNHLLGADRG